MFFPWVGFLEEIRLADVFVHYDDVQFSKGSFVNRQRVKVEEGTRWMTVPLRDFHFGQRINEVQIAPSSEWKGKHLDLLTRSFKGSPYSGDALRIAEEVYATEFQNIGALARASFLSLARYFSVDTGTRFVDVEELGIPGSNSERVLNVVRHLGGTVYVSGHGGANYLDHEAFERVGIRVEYMDYRQTPYNQQHGPFTPYVSALDLIAQCGRHGLRYICSETVTWREFLIARSSGGETRLTPSKRTTPEPE